MDLKLPLYQDRLALTAEGWMGKNLSDLRGGILQGINTKTGAEIHATGGFAQLSWTAVKTERYKNVLHPASQWMTPMMLISTMAVEI